MHMRNLFGSNELRLRRESLHFSPDGKTVLAVDGFTGAQRWSINAPQRVGNPFSFTNGHSFGSHWSLDGRFVLLAGSRVNTDKDGSPELGHQGEARVWDVETGSLVRRWLTPDTIISAVFSPKDPPWVLVGEYGRTSRLWSVNTGLPVGPPFQHSGAVRCAAFSPNGDTILTACEDGTARLWDAATSKPLGPPLVYASPLIRAAFHPNGKTLVTTCQDGLAPFWETRSRRKGTAPPSGCGPKCGLALRRDAEGGSHVLVRDEWLAALRRLEP